MRFAATGFFLAYSLAVVFDLIVRWFRTDRSHFRLFDPNATAWWAYGLLAVALGLQGLVWFEDRQWWRAALLMVTPFSVWAIGRAAIRRRRGLPIRSQ